MVLLPGILWFPVQTLQWLLRTYSRAEQSVLYDDCRGAHSTLLSRLTEILITAVYLLYCLLIICMYKYQGTVYTKRIFRKVNRKYSVSCCALYRLRNENHTKYIRLPEKYLVCLLVWVDTGNFFRMLPVFCLFLDAVIGDLLESNSCAVVVILLFWNIVNSQALISVIMTLYINWNLRYRYCVLEIVLIKGKI